MDITEHLKELRNKTFATLGENPIIPDSQLKSILKKDIWSEKGYKSHSARLTTCGEFFNLDIREDIKEEHFKLIEVYDPDTEQSEWIENSEYNVEYELHNTPIDLQYSDIDSLLLAHLTINLNAPNSVLREDIWRIVEALRKDCGNHDEIIISKKRNWAVSNVLEHIDLYLAEVQQDKEFKPSERIKWIPPNSDSDDQIKASTNEKNKALKLLDDQILHQLYIEIYSDTNKTDLDRQ